MDLADDDELMALMTAANIAAVFVDVESPNEEALRETKKFQNLRRGGSMVEKVRRIQDPGLEVWGSMILGFDSDDERIFAAQHRFLTEARISTAMVGMLAAIPKTPLHAHLAAAGAPRPRRRPCRRHQCAVLQMTREALSEGYVRLLAEFYEPAAYFDRLDDLYIAGAIETERGWRRYAQRHPWRRRARQARQLLEAAGLALRVLSQVREKQLRRIYRQRLAQLLRRRPDPAVWRVCAIKCAMHYHTHRLVDALQRRSLNVLNTF